MGWIDLKRFLVAGLFLFCLISSAFSQSANALYLKDGSRIIGYVIDLDSVGEVSIRTTEGELMSFPMEKVEQINWSYVIK